MWRTYHISPHASNSIENSPLENHIENHKIVHTHTQHVDFSSQFFFFLQRKLKKINFNQSVAIIIVFNSSFASAPSYNFLRFDYKPPVNVVDVVVDALHVVACANVRCVRCIVHPFCSCSYH